MVIAAFLERHVAEKAAATEGLMAKVSDVARAYGIESAAILGPSRRTDVVEARDWLILMLVFDGGMSHRAIGEFLHRDRSAISRAEKRARAKQHIVTMTTRG